VASIDAFRGFVMTLMLAEIMHLDSMAERVPGNAFWSLVSFHTSHVEWAGASLHDLIQPGFSLLVGMSMAFSLASRKARGQSVGQMLGHAIWRSLLLIALGIALRSQGRVQTNFTFEDTLTQIGMGYPFLFLLSFASWRWQVGALAGILAGYWGAFVMYPAPAPEFNYAAVGVPADWPHHYQGLMAHFNKNSNLAWAFDQWFLNLFPRAKPFVFNGGGYATLSFIPTLGTMLIGLLGGTWLRTPRSEPEKLKGLLGAGAVLVLTAWTVEALGVCPIVKRIWTPAWTLYSGGLVLLLISAFYAWIEWKRGVRWSYPLTVVGANSILAYLMAGTIERPMLEMLVRHLTLTPFAILGPAYERLLLGAAGLAIFWLVLEALYKRRVFLKI
jgi:predicted acyltransferase